MLSKLYFPKGNDKLFYLFLKEYCCYNSILIDQLRNDIKFWNLWLGKNIFDFDLRSYKNKRTSQNCMPF